MRVRSVLFSAATAAVVLLGCSGDPTSSDEYAALERQLAQATDKLATITAERDSVLEQIASPQARYDKVVASQEAVAAIIADPAAFGSEDEVLDLLMEYATEDAVMDDVALGSIGMRQAWKETVYRADANIETFAAWAAEDGSMGGSLWVWSGTAANGEPFELIGVNADHYDADGLIAYERVVWPYDADYVQQTFQNGN